MNKRIMIATTLLVLAGFAAASALTVKQRQDTASLFAERYTIGDALAIDASLVAPVPFSQPAAGVPGSPVEMTSSLPDARTALTQDHWSYVVAVKEATAGALGTGQFVIELQIDGVTHASVHFAQQAAEPTSIEGVRAVFDIGNTLDASNLYYVVVKHYVPTGPTLDLLVRSNPNDNLTWLGVGGSIDGIVNPDLVMNAGSTLRLTARNADGGYHNIGIKNGGNLVSPPGWSGNIDTEGEEAVISWTPSGAGTYTYECQYHASMKGALRVV